MNNPAGCPRFSCGNDILEQAFILAAATLSSNTKPMRAGLLRENRLCLMAGADYPTQWTRDAAINVWFAEALLDPETVRPRTWPWPSGESSDWRRTACPGSPSCRRESRTQGWTAWL